MATIKGGYTDPYEPGTRRERAYMCGISSVYQDDNIDDAATVAATAIEDSIIVQVPDTWDLDNLDESVIL
jgi:hypothetical protein